MLRASVLVIGDEILGGFVRDTNSGWIAARLQSHGVELDRIVTVPDDLDAIDEALTTELARDRPRLVLTTGGVGSTPDDITYEAVAASLGRELVEAPDIAPWIARAVDWTASHGLEVDDVFVERMTRMARVPDGARTIARGGGFAPGIRVDVDGGIDDRRGATVVVLPGVPSQVRAIVSEAVEPQLLAGRGTEQAVVEITHGYPESLLNEVFASIAARHPGVKVGSYPDVPMLVRLRGPADEVASARRLLETFLDDLDARPAGVRIRHAWSQRFGGQDEAS